MASTTLLLVHHTLLHTYVTIMIEIHAVEGRPNLVHLHLEVGLDLPTPYHAQEFLEGERPVSIHVRLHTPKDNRGRPQQQTRQSRFGM